jgi:putative transposase
VGWMLAHRENQHLAQRLIRETVLKEGIVRDRLTIHSDRGPSMRSQTVAQLLATLGITKSHSRPHVCDDNPFSESQFKTLKYRPEFPDRFASFEHALDFCGKFVHWQNYEHHHWGLGLLTPAVVHFGQADAILAARQAVLDAAHTAHPERFVRRPPRPLALPAEVWINPPADQPDPRMLQVPRDTNFKPQVSQTG